MRKTIKFFFTRVYTITSIVLFALSYGAMQAYAVYYPTDNITNPTCAPGDSGCYVSLLPSQTSNAGKLLVTDGTNPSWSSSLTRDLTINGVTVGAGAGAISTNSVLGYQALSSNTSGAYNVAIGNNALDANTIGISNIGLGHNALGANISGGYNIAAGWNTLAANTSGSNNIAFGSDTMGLNTEGIQNIAMGQQALVSNLSGQYNIAIGPQSLFYNSTGGNNLAYGYYAGYNSQTGSNNIFIGAQTGLGITTGSNNTIIGANVSGLSSSLSNNIIIADGQGNQRINIDSSGNIEMGGNIYSAGLKWQTTAPAADRQWVDVGYGNGMFVAVSQNAGTDKIMTSPDGINWTQRTHPLSGLKSITYGNGMFVAAGHVNARFLTSTDGVTWTARTGTGQVFDIVYGNGLFVGAKIDNAGLRIITSPDGITWTDRATPVGADKPWVGITYGNGLYVAVAESTGTQSVMTSPDGINWTLQTHPSLSGGLENIAYGDGRFVAVGVSGNVMTSPDGVNWTLQTFPNTALLYRVTYGDGLFVTAGAFSTTNNNIYTSPDGITWTTRTVPKNDWAGVAYGNGRFVMVAYSGTLGSRVAYSGAMRKVDNPTLNIFQGGLYSMGNVGIGTTAPSDLFEVNSGTASGGGQYIVRGGYVDNYRFGNTVRYQAYAAGGTSVTPTAFSGSMFTLNANAYNGTSYVNNARIDFLTNETQSVGSAGSRIRMMVTLNGTASLADGINIYGTSGGYIENLFKTGIGTGGAPSYTLQVGSGSVVGIVSRFQNSTGTCDINPTTTSLSCSSDRNLKTNITNLNNTILNQITTLQPVTYNWISDTQGPTQTGFIAQDVEAIFPNLVSTDLNTNLKSLNYIGLIPYAIEGIRELDIKVNQQASLDTEIAGSFGYLAKEFLNTVNVYIKDLTVGKLKIDGDVCVDDVCISKEQFKQMLIDQQNKTGQVNNVVQENNPEIIPENQNNEEEPLPDNQEIPVPPIE